MNRTVAATILVLMTAPVFADPAEAVASAVADIRRQNATDRYRYRYLDLGPIPATYRPEVIKVLSFHCNQLSREAEFEHPKVVADHVVRINIADYGWNSKVWERLKDVDPYFHVSIEVDEIQDWGYTDERGRWIKTRSVKTGKKVRKAAAAPWLDARQISELILHTQSEVPIVRADWFLYQTAIQKDRKAGYYDFLGAGKKKKEFDELVGLDIKAAQRLKKEVAAIRETSIVALHNRQLFRFATLSGGYWESRDAKDNTGKRNALRNLDGDYQYDAQEVYGSLPNGLFAFFLADGQGNRTDTAPDDIAADGQAGGTDRRVHVGLSCIRCHVEGIRPINDWGRRNFRGDIQLQSPDYEKLKRLKQLYLSDLDRHIRRDQEDYAAVLARLNGAEWTSAANAKAYAALWDWYAERPRTRKDVATEAGLSEDELVARLKRYASATGQLDPLLAGLLQDPPIALRVEHLEEVFGTLMLAVGP